MDYFEYRNGALYAENVVVAKIAEEIGTPCYIYSRATMERHWHAFNDAFGNYPHQICYSVKANDNLAVLNLLARLGSGFDIVSGGELLKVIKAGGDPARVIFSGVCKQDWEIRLALESGVSRFNIESQGEVDHISSIACELGTVAEISVRINPDVDPKTHPYISTGLRNNKFGLSPDKALPIYLTAEKDRNLKIHGVACHIGSQITELSPYRDALKRVLHFIDRLSDHGITLTQIDFGGGLGVRYLDEQPPGPDQYWQMIFDQLRHRQDRIQIVIEPGRAIMANAGILLTRVHYLKKGEVSNFCVVDAGMNDLIRPSLYQAQQEIIEVEQNSDTQSEVYDVVGPVCESSDFLGKGHALQVRGNDLLAVRTCGAYCSVMSSNYNSRPRAAEVMVDGDQYHIIKPREELASLYAGERLLP